MNVKTHATHPICFSTLCALLVGCAAPAQEESRVQIRTSALSHSESGDLIPHNYQVQLRNLSAQVVSTGVGLTLVGMVASPVRDGITLQATDVVWVDDTVYASYNVAGDTFLGALQVIDVSQPERPKVVAEATYPAAEIARIQVSGSRILAAAADASYGGTLESFTYQKRSLSYDGYAVVGSHAATFLDRDGYRVLVSSGDRNGAVTRFDLASGSAQLVASIPLEDARWVGALEDQGILAVSGSPGSIVRYLPNTVGGYDESAVAIAEMSQGAPSWAGRKHDLLYMATNAEGLAVYDLRTLQEVGRLRTPGSANGLAIGIDEKVAFVADGEAGIRVIDIVDPTNPLELASLDVEDSGSANAIALHAEHLALADGRGGVKLLSYQRTSEATEDPDGDGQPSDSDTDDDDDGVLDTDDSEPANPNVVCPADKLDFSAHFIGDLFDLPCDHEDMEPPTTGVVLGTLPTDHDWFSSQYYAYTLARDRLLLNNSEKYLPKQAGICGNPYYFAEHWYSTARATEAGVYRFEMASYDDSWLFVDGRLVADLGGSHPDANAPLEVELSVGAHRFDIYAVQRHKVLSGALFHQVGSPSAKARLEFEQHLCLDKNDDTDRDGVLNGADMAPLERP